MDRGNTKDEVSLQIFQVKIRTIQISVNLLTSRQFFPERLWDLDLPTRKSKDRKKKKIKLRQIKQRRHTGAT